MNRSFSAPAAALIVVGIRWVDRLIGFASMLILARLLLPEDFGILAMASIVIGLVDVMFDMGVNIGLIQNRNATQDDFDSAWTLRIIQASIVTIILFVAADPVAKYFNDSRVAEVIQVLAVSVLIVAFENIGVVNFQKEMQFGQEFNYFFGRRMVGFVTTILAALALHSYWALVIGTLSSRVAGVMLSYLMHPMRPRISVRRMKSILAFSSWNLLRGVSNYLSENLHRLIVGRRESASVMGAYTLASDVTAIPSSELLAPINRILFPILVRVKEDPAELKRVFFLSVAVQTMIGVPAGVGLALIAPELVAALLGDKWAAAIPFVQVMGIINVVTALCVSWGYLLLALGRVRIATLHSWGQVLLFLAVTVFLVPNADAMVIAETRLGVSVVGLLSFAAIVLREFPEWHTSDVVASIWRPCIASLTMGVALASFPETQILSNLSLLAVKTAMGAAVYFAAQLSLWWLSGRQHGAETYLFGKIIGAWNSFGNSK